MTNSLISLASVGAGLGRRTGLEPLLRLSLAGWGAVAASGAVGLVLGRLAAPYGAGRIATWALVAGSCLVTCSALVWSPATDVAWSLALGWILLTLAAIDVVALRLPDVLTLPLALAGLLQAWATHADLALRVVGCVMGWAAFVGLSRAYQMLRRRPGLGLGDAKLLGAAGAWLGLAALPNMVLLACLFGFVWLLARRFRTAAAAMVEPLPFGAPLALATWIMWLRG